MWRWLVLAVGILLVGHSPDGLAWDRQRAQDLVGTNAWVHDGITIGDTTVLLLTPNGRRPMTDPPYCPLGIYPDELPQEVWATTTP